MRHQTSELLKQLVIMLVGEGLSRIPTFSMVMKHFKKGCFYLVLSALLVSIFLAANAYALYEYLVWRGLSPLESFLIVDALVLLLVIIAKLSMCSHFSHLFSKPSSCARNTTPPVTTLAAEILTAFVDGMKTQSHTHCPKEHCGCEETEERDNRGC